MKERNKMNEKLVMVRKDYEEGATDAVTSPETYLYSALGGLVYGFGTKSVMKGLAYAVFGIGFQVILDGVTRIPINRICTTDNYKED